MWACWNQSFRNKGVGRIFSRGAARGFLQTLWGGAANVVKFRFHHSKLRKQPLFAEIYKMQAGDKAPLPPFPTPMIWNATRENILKQEVIFKACKRFKTLILSANRWFIGKKRISTVALKVFYQFYGTSMQTTIACTWTFHSCSQIRVFSPTDMRRARKFVVHFLAAKGMVQTNLSQNPALTYGHLHLCCCVG